MPERVVDRNTISINAEFYRLARPVQFYLASRQPDKIATGDFTDETNPLASTWTIKDLTGGIGVKFMDVQKREHLDRVFYTTAWLRHYAQTILSRLATATAQATAAPGSAPSPL